MKRIQNPKILGLIRDIKYAVVAAILLAGVCSWWWLDYNGYTGTQRVIVVQQ